MKIIKLYYISMLAIGILLVAYMPIYNTQASPVSEVIDISIEPTSSFISINNMAPGDYVTKSLKVVNSGNVNFHYIVSAVNELGDQILFDNLLLNLQNDGKTIYEGFLKDFNNINMGDLGFLKRDYLLITVGLPKEVGNEVKHKTTSVAFQLTATADSKIIDNANQLPDTSTNMFSYLLLGSVFIIFGLSIFIYRFYKSRHQ